ncbi:ATP-binding protein [Clostridium paridis]|uniref:ATP-binding protein n=1 Tax=Clostridium paridis TaxID=2803863 RepID=A0A937K4U2_9CLOT|nr:ATP-binding protein [Clostridium paridis]MBL4933027.1 ATP-binding protein [Clostridium paridis]
MKEEGFQKRSEEKLVKKSYNCGKCNDTGWILAPQEHSAPIAISCSCRELDRIKTDWERSGIKTEQSNLTFSNFCIWNESSGRAKDIALAYYKDFNSIRRTRKNSILFCGQVGSGKSHLSIALALNFLRKNVKVVYMPYRDAIMKIKQNIMDDEYYQKIISKYQLAEVLLIDDLFKGKISESDISIIFEILNYRYLNNLPIIVSTECVVDKLLYIDEAIGSRIYEMSKDYIMEIGKGKENNYRLR